MERDEKKFSDLLELVHDTGAAQAAANGGTTPADGFWRVEPPSAAQWKRGDTIQVFTPEGKVLRARWPKRGVTPETVTILEQGLARHGFDVARARRARNQRAKRDTTAQVDQATEVEAQRRQKRAAQAPPPSAPEPMAKVWPREEIVNADIDPIQAIEMLACVGDGEHKPRPISPSNVRRFVKIIKEKRWIPDYMHVDWFGQVMNGRNRLTAIIEAEATVPCKIIYGCDPAMFPVMDTPNRRTGGHALYSKSLADEKGCGPMSSALRLLANYDSDAAVSSWGHGRLENDEIVDLAKRYPGLAQAMESASLLHQGRKIGRAKFAPSAAIVFCYLVVREFPTCGDLLDQYILAVTSGANVASGDPRKLLYDLMMSKNSPKRGDVKIPPVKQLALLLKMWNKWLLGETGEVASWRDNEAMPIALCEADAVLDD